MKTRTMAALCSMILLTWAAEVRAQVRHEPLPTPLDEVLGLSAEQKAAIAQERASFGAATRPLVENLDALRSQMEQAVAAGDRSRLSALLLAEWDAKAAVRKEAAACQQRIAAILTPGQSEKVELLREIARLAGRDPRFLEHAGLESEAAAGDRERHERPHDDKGGERLRHER